MEKFERVIKANRAFATSEEMAWDAGYRCGKEGPNESNSHFRWFRTPEMTRAWEAGKKEAQS